MPAHAIRQSSGTLQTVPFSLAPALGLVAWLSTDVLAQGGLAPLVGAFVIAVFIGVPLASAEWQDGAPSDDDTWQVSARASTELWGVLVIAALAAPIVRELGTAGIGIAVVAWPVAAIVTYFGSLRVLRILVGLGLFGVFVLGAQGVASSPPWTLLDPQWAEWPRWGSSAVAGGILMTGAGLGHWGHAPKPVPGYRRLVWTTTGVAMLAGLGAAVLLGASWELAPPSEGAPIPVIRLLATAVAGTGVMCRTNQGDGRATLPILGVLATLWMAFPAWDALPLFWNSLLPLGPAMAAVALFRRSRGLNRLLGAVGTVVFAAAAIAAWPGLPTSPLAAGAAAMLPVLAVWYAGTRTALSPAMERAR